DPLPEAVVTRPVCVPATHERVAQWHGDRLSRANGSRQPRGPQKAHPDIQLPSERLSDASNGGVASDLMPVDHGLWGLQGRPLCSNSPLRASGSESQACSPAPFRGRCQRPSTSFLSLFKKTRKSFCFQRNLLAWSSLRTIRNSRDDSAWLAPGPTR